MLSVVQCKVYISGVRHLIQICNLATGSKVVSWAANSSSATCANCAIIAYAQLAPLTSVEGGLFRGNSPAGRKLTVGSNSPEGTRFESVTYKHFLFFTYNREARYYVSILFLDF